MAVEDVGEAIMFVSYLSLVMAGINIIWGMFLYPWGLVGFSFAVVDIVLFFLAKATRDIYDARDYEKARDRMKIISFTGFVTGLIIVGVYAYRVYVNLDNIITSRYLVRATPGEIFSPPQFPRKKG